VLRLLTSLPLEAKLINKYYYVKIFCLKLFVFSSFIKFKYSK
jgi:hypothetical protein